MRTPCPVASPRAWRSLEEALADPAATGTTNHPLLLAYLGEAHLLAGRPDDALAVARRALDLAHRQKERGNEAWVLRLLGEIAAQADPPDLESAEAHYRQALARADELGMRPLVAHCHLGLGKLYRRTGDRAKAGEHLATATTMYREMDMGFWLEQAEAAGAEASHDASFDGALLVLALLAAPLAARRPPRPSASRFRPRCWRGRMSGGSVSPRARGGIIQWPRPLARRRRPPASDSGLLDLWPRGRADAVPGERPRAHRVDATRDAPHAGLVRLLTRGGSCLALARAGFSLRETRHARSVGATRSAPDIRSPASARR